MVVAGASVHGVLAAVTKGRYAVRLPCGTRGTAGSESCTLRRVLRDRDRILRRCSPPVRCAGSDWLTTRVTQVVQDRNRAGVA